MIGSFVLLTEYVDAHYLRVINIIPLKISLRSSYHFKLNMAVFLPVQTRMWFTQTLVCINPYIKSDSNWPGQAMYVCET